MGVMSDTRRPMNVVGLRFLRVRKSLTVNAVSLMGATVATNVLGVVFWGVAAHLEPAAAVGRAAATVAALILLSTIAQLNLTNVFVRLLPRAGRLGTELVRSGYLAVVLLAVLVGGIYVATGLSARVVTGGWSARAMFTAAVVVLAIFALQDSVLTAFRLAPWVPVENISFAVGKLLLLPLLVALPIGAPLVVSWVIPAALAVVGVTVVLFGRVLPARQRLRGALPRRRGLISLIAGEYLGSICATATFQLMPLLVLWRLGPASAAYFTLPWLASLAITILLWNVGFAFAVEILGAHGSSEALLRRTLLLWGAVALGAVAVCLLAAYPLLDLAGGPVYASHGAGLLRLIGLAAPFSAVVTLFGTFAWLDRRIWMLASFQAAMGAAMVVLTLLLLPRAGLMAVGWANLITQAGAAAVMGPLALRRARRGSLAEAL